MTVTLPTAELSFTVDGTPQWAAFVDINALPGRWSGRESFTILETGFGLGLNFLAAWDAMRTDPSRPRRLHFISTETHPLTQSDLRRALAPFAERAHLAGTLVLNWPPPYAGFHRIHFDAGQVTLTLLFGEAAGTLRELDARVDAFFLDGISPARNPGIWSPEVVRELARLAAPGATLVTPAVASGVRTALGDAGFTTERREGSGRKHEMLTGRWREAEAPARVVDRRAVVVGAGLAGLLCADRLAARGWDVALVESQPDRDYPRVGLLRPVANLRDAMNAKVSRSAFLYALQHFGSLQIEGYHLQFEAGGALQLAADDDEAARMKAIVESQAHDARLLAWVDRDAARAIASRDVTQGGWWFPSGAWVSMPSLATATLARAGERVRRLTGRSVARIERAGANWRAVDGNNALIAEAPAMVLANAADAKRLAPDARLVLNRVRGQVTYLPPDPSRTLDRIVAGNGYVAPLPEGGHAAGATFQHDDFDESVRASDHRENLARIESLLPGFTAGVHPMTLEGWTGFRTTVPDRLPVFGEGAAPGLHFATGLGSRGLLWGPIGAELVASALEGDAPPLPRSLAGAISPKRFLS